MASRLASGPGQLILFLDAGTFLKLYALSLMSPIPLLEVFCLSVVRVQVDRLASLLTDVLQPQLAELDTLGRKEHLEAIRQVWGEGKRA